MERYQRGHQQPVEGARPVGALLVLACAVVAVAVAVLRGGIVRIPVLVLVPRWLHSLVWACSSTALSSSIRAELL